MEEGDKSTGIGGEISTRVSAGSTSWLFASRQRFTIELRPGETTIVSWKRLIKDAQDTSPHLTAPNTEDSLDECCRDDKSTSKQNGLLVKFDKLECKNETVLSVAQPSRKRSKNMAEAQGEKDGDHEPRVSNKDASISPSNSEDVDKYRRVTVHSNNLENNTDSLATNQKYVEKKPCKKLESPVRKLMIENDVEGISTKVEQREGTCGELPDLNLPVYPVQSEASMLGDVPTGDIQEVLGYEEKVALKKQYSMDNVIEDKICDLYDLYTQGIDEDKGTQIRKLYVELAELWPNGIMGKHGIKSAICRAKERRRALCEHDKVRENRRKKSAQKTKTGVVKACSVSQLQAEQENQASASSGHVLALPCMTIYCKETLDQHLAAPLESCSVPPNSSLDISEEEKNEKMIIPMLKKQMKHKNRVKKLSMKLEKGSHKSHKQAIKHPDGVSHELAGPPSCGHPV
ncbi:hypothetical protein ERO13_A09G005500v2 [Gossypium hirsutum]|uniref:Uncharacterized protein n=2 Tax=Gossypium TaxID=3633 RepID=A0A5D2NWP1_GOSTO|nr:hypothetical protein ERO13_A09G005500v2 [Gossypium hirsutum]TYH00803.1 hypothetical protein ES288_A09G007000v1 [Gossypium darwinii]TYI08507.1 hypothetical protein ES332_A09G006300v1 [Gossypium tomentosum]